MADIRINSLPSTATSFNTDDYIAIDGASGGTRKMLAATLPLTDVTLGGASGPSVKSSLSSRAPRQGLVFDGTAGATVANVPAFGTGDFTFAAWVNQPTLAAAYLCSATGDADSAFLYLVGNGTFQWWSNTAARATSSAGAFVANKWTLLTATRTGGTTTLYANGVSVGSGADSQNLTSAIDRIGQRAGGTNILNGSLIPLIYNRALSASEVVSLYEAGAPAGADYNSASNTAINTSAWANYSNPTYAYQSFTSASATGFTASNSTNPASGLSVAVMAPQVTTFRAGTRYLVTFSATLTSGEAPKLRIGDSAGKSNEHTVTAGSNSVVLTTTSSVTATENIIFFNTLATSFSVSSVSVTRLGLLLAPDAAQAGGGLTWYDTSGNAANITLPASGVSWNVPSSLKTASGWTFGGNLTVSGGTVDNSPASGGPLFRTIRPANTGSAAFASIPNGALSASNVEWYSGLIGSSGDYKIWAYNGSTNTFAFSSTPAGNVTLAGNLTVSGTDYNYVGGNKFFRGFTNYNVLYTGATELSINNQADGANLASFKNNGNLLIGTTTDGGQKLQVSGTGYFSGNVGIGANAANRSLEIHNASTPAVILRNTGQGTDQKSWEFSVSGNVLRGAIENDAFNTEKFWLEVTRSSSSLSFDSVKLNTGAGTTALTLDSSQNATFAGTISATKSVAGAYDINFRNTNSGSAYLRLRMGNDTSSDASILYAFGSGWSTSGPYLTSSAVWECTQSGGISIYASQASGAFRIYTGANTTARMTVKSDGKVNMSALPTSSAGLSTGDIWNDSGTLKIV